MAEEVFQSALILRLEHEWTTKKSRQKCPCRHWRDLRHESRTSFDQQASTRHRQQKTLHRIQQVQSVQCTTDQMPGHLHYNSTYCLFWQQNWIGSFFGGREKTNPDSRYRKNFLRYRNAMLRTSAECLCMTKQKEKKHIKMETFS